MGNIRHPRRGSKQYWPRKRSKATIARIRSTVSSPRAKLLRFIGYKAGMTHVQVIDNRPKSLTKGEKIILPTTIIECPPLHVAGAVFYASSLNGLHVAATILVPKLDALVARRMPLPKKQTKTLDDVQDFTDVRLLVYSVPQEATNQSKRPKLSEMPIGGTKEEKLNFIKSVWGKTIAVNDVFDPGNSVDVHGITKGKGFQGTVKRFGVPIRQHKAEKTKRGIGTLGSWTPKRVQHTVAQAGKMGFHQRTEFNKQIIKIVNGKEVTPAGGITKYGVVKNSTLLVKGSVPGPRKRAVLLAFSIRPNPRFTKDAPEVTYISA